MSEISARQLRTLRRQIRKLFSREYIPLTSSTTTLSIGDVLSRKYTTGEMLDGSLLGVTENDVTTGTRQNRQFATLSSVDITFKAAGQVAPADMPIAQAKAGVAVTFANQNSMFLKVLGLHETTLKDFSALETKVIQAYVEGKVSARSHVVRGMVVADRYYLQYGGTSGGSVAIELDADASSSPIEAKANADFSVVWAKSVGFDIDAPNGGPLAYRVSRIRVRRSSRPQAVTESVLKGVHEAEAMDAIPLARRAELARDGLLEVVDSTDGLILSLEHGEED